MMAYTPPTAPGSTMASAAEVPVQAQRKRQKVTGRAFYESIGSPKMILAPMVDQSEFVRKCFSAWILSFI